MASLIPGFEYDIFISYRPKDNKGDKWVSEFIEALKTELESPSIGKESIFNHAAELTDHPNPELMFVVLLCMYVLCFQTVF